MPSTGGIHSPTALLSMISCALVLAAMIVFGLAERAPLKKLRMKLMVGESGGDIGCWCCMQATMSWMEWCHLQSPMVPPPLLSNQAMMQLCKTSDVGISRHVILHNSAALPPPPTPSLQSDIPPSSCRTKPGRQAEGMLSGLHRSWRSERRRDLEPDHSAQRPQSSPSGCRLKEAKLSLSRRQWHHSHSLQSGYKPPQ